MKVIRSAGIAMLILVFVMGCAEAYQQLKTHSVGEANVTHQDLIDNHKDDWRPTDTKPR